MKHAILNVRTNHILTARDGSNVWNTWQEANDAMNESFSGGDHLEVVLIQRSE